MTNTPKPQANTLDEILAEFIPPVNLANCGKDMGDGTFDISDCPKPHETAKQQIEALIDLHTEKEVKRKMDIIKMSDSYTFITGEKYYNQRMMDRATNEARIDEVHLSEQGTDTEVSGLTKEEYYSRRYKELKENK